MAKELLTQDDESDLEALIRGYQIIKPEIQYRNFASVEDAIDHLRRRTADGIALLRDRQREGFQK